MQSYIFAWNWINLFDARQMITIRGIKIIVGIEGHGMKPVPFPVSILIKGRPDIATPKTVSG